MDASPCTTSITIEFDCQFRVHLKQGYVIVDVNHLQSLGMKNKVVFS